jgi:hypothetical protein
MSIGWSDHRQTRPRHVAAAALVLIGQLVAVVGLPLPAPSAPASPASVPAAAKAPEKVCGCACGGGCGSTCCCSKRHSAAKPEKPDAVGGRAWHWVPGVRALTCRGHGPAGLAQLPPALPFSGPAPWRRDDAAGQPTPIADEHTLIIPTRPPTPPPRYC